VLGTGVCNFFTGLAGGLPVCGAMARMTLNANCGARSRTSIVINGFTVLIIMFALMSFFRYVPQPVIGAVLVPVAMGMVKIDVYRHYWRVDKPSLLITFITWAVCVFVDPTYAILVAILMGLLRSARNEGHVAPARWAPLKAPGSSVQLYQPAGKWDYTNIITHKQRIDQARTHGETVALCMHDVYLMDTDGVDVLKAIVASGVAIVGLGDAPREQCAKNDWFDKVRECILRKRRRLGGHSPAQTRDPLPFRLRPLRCVCAGPQRWARVGRRRCAARKVPDP
jgi:MFS superfamily sulfate permease-like transporter